MTDPTDPQPQPVTNAAGWASTATLVVGAILSVLAVAGVISPDDQDRLGAVLAAAVTAVVGAVSTILAAWHARRRVTPIARPRDARGRTLVPHPAQYGEHAAKADPLDDWPGALNSGDTQDIPRVSRRPLGRKPPTNAPRIKLTASMVPAATYTPPPSVDWYSKVPASTWGMDGNDKVGDCTLAEVDHSTKARQVAAGNPEIKSTAAEALAAYSAITGYDPHQTRPDGSNPTDQGAVMQDVRDYWRKHGITLGGRLDKLTLFAEVDHTDLNLIRWCVHRFGAVALGINFPDTAMDQFDNGQPWDVVKGASIEGGHAISMIGYDADFAYVVTWGQVQKMTWAFFRAYVEEAWTDVSADWINASGGQDPLGEVAYALGEQFAQVTGKPNPFPAPTPEPPTPSPAPTPDGGTVAVAAALAEQVDELMGRILARKKRVKEDVVVAEAWREAGL